jgi:hypothetical protein
LFAPCIGEVSQQQAEKPIIAPAHSQDHGLINFKNTKAKCRHLK